jgi:hypothetical protein
MLWTILLVLLSLWLLAVIGQIGGPFVHLLPVAALVIFLAELILRRRAAL